jgi:hypothetical protein
VVNIAHAPERKSKPNNFLTANLAALKISWRKDLSRALTLHFVSEPKQSSLNFQSMEQF